MPPTKTKTAWLVAGALGCTTFGVGIALTYPVGAAPADPLPAITMPASSGAPNASAAPQTSAAPANPSGKASATAQPKPKPKPHTVQPKAPVASPQSPRTRVSPVSYVSPASPVSAH
jgi:hypothetical protein